MDSLRENLDQLAAAKSWTYRASHELAAEPAAWAAIALAAHGRSEAAVVAADWLASRQQDDGPVGVSQSQDDPRWPTSLALLAWCVLDRSTGDNAYGSCIDRAAQWCLADRGKAAQRSPQIGHDPTLVGWSWAAKTATWLEPTCYCVLGLSAAGFSDHPRVIEGRRVIADRLLPSGGANYGNTIVLGQPLLAHLATTGIALIALAGHDQGERRVLTSVEFLHEHIGGLTTPISLSWGVLGLTAHGRRPPEAESWIDRALSSRAWQPLATYERALLLLAARESLDWLPTKAERSRGVAEARA
jgi:hypothetical protein